LFLHCHPGGDRRADCRSFEPRRFPRGDRDARGPDGKTESPGNGAARLEKIESAPENGMVSEASNPQDLVSFRGSAISRKTLAGTIGSAISAGIAVQEQKWDDYATLARNLLTEIC